MSLIRITFVAAIASALTWSPAHADPRILSPSSNWILNYDDDSCALQRMFGREGEQIIFEVRQFQPGPDFQLLLASSDLQPRTLEPAIRYGEDVEAWRAENASIVSYGEGMRGVVLNDQIFSVELKEELDDLDENEGQLRKFDLMSDQAAVAARESRVESITVLDTFGDDVTLQTGDMHPPMEALRQCMDELLTHWGIDTEAHGTLSRPALPSNYDRMARRVIRTYPTSMLRAGVNARLQVRLSISEEGRVTGCHLQMPIAHDEFREDSCDGLQSARFDPALDAEGNPIASYWSTTITYSIH